MQYRVRTCYNHFGLQRSYFRVRTGFHVVDPQVEAAQARLEAMRTGRHLKIKKPAPPATNKPKGKRVVKRGFSACIFRSVYKLYRNILHILIK